MRNLYKRHKFPVGVAHTLVRLRKRTNASKMAADENKSFQQFPQATFTALTREQIEEAAAISANLADGQKSAGQSEQDPYSASVQYLEKHHIVEVFQNITSKIAFEKPADPLQFMIDEIEQMKRK